MQSDSKTRWDRFDWLRLPDLVRLNYPQGRWQFEIDLERNPITELAYQKRSSHSLPSDGKTFKSKSRATFAMTQKDALNDILMVVMSFQFDCWHCGVNVSQKWFSYLFCCDSVTHHVVFVDIQDVGTRQQPINQAQSHAAGDSYRKSISKRWLCAYRAGKLDSRLRNSLARKSRIRFGFSSNSEILFGIQCLTVTYVINAINHLAFE